MLNENNLIEQLPEDETTEVFCEEDFVNIICRDTIIDSNKNPYLGDLIKSMRIKKGSTLVFPTVNKIELNNVEDDYVEYFLLDKWINEIDGSTVYHTTTSQTFISKRKSYRIPKNAYVQLVEDKQTMIKQYKIISTNQLYIDYIALDNSYGLKLTTTSQFNQYIKMYETTINFEFILNGEFEGNSLEQEVLLKFFEGTNKTYIPDIDTIINIGLFISEASTGD